MTNNKKILDWYDKELKKDQIELESQKKVIISKIIKENKDGLFEKSKKITLWQRIKKVLMNI
jgi:hypothetical protein